MKPRNFPARKLARQLRADQRKPQTGAEHVVGWTKERGQPAEVPSFLLESAQRVRTKRLVKDGRAALKLKDRV